MADDNFLYSFNKLTCIIAVGDYDPAHPQNIVGKYTFTECVDIDIKDSYNTLTNTATVTLPRDILLATGEKDETGARVGTVLQDASSIFQQGQRIMIALGYDDNNKILFDGFITSLIPKSPFVLICEDFGWKLKKTAIDPISIIPHTSESKGTIVNDLMKVLLDGTSISLHPVTKDMNIKLGYVILEKSKSLGEILEQWKRNYGLLSFIKFYDGKPTLALSRTYFSVNDDKTLINGEAANIPTAHFQDNVVGDNLTFKYLDYDSLALEATTVYADNSRLRLTIILNKSFATQKAKYDGLSIDAKRKAEAPNEFEIVNESKISKKQAKKNFKEYSQIKDNALNVKNIQDRFDLSQYNVRTYHEYDVDRDTLIKNAKAKFHEISQTGIEGDIVLFGDFGLRAAGMIRLYDGRNPEKNGAYAISDVRTKFGIGGYRQTIKIPFKRGE